MQPKNAFNPFADVEYKLYSHSIHSDSRTYSVTAERDGKILSRTEFVLFGSHFMSPHWKDVISIEYKKAVARLEKSIGA